MRNLLERLFKRSKKPADPAGTPPVPGDATTRPVAWSAMAQLLEELEKIGKDYPELYDTDVRERMWELVDHLLIQQTGPVSVSTELGMFSPEANSRLQAALEENLTRLKGVFTAFHLDTPAKRLGSFHNPRLHTESGKYVDEFFGSP